MAYITGFVDIRNHTFYPNTIPSHDKNAKTIIEERGWVNEYFNDPYHNISPSDFLVFRKGFAQIGSSSTKTISVSSQLYKFDVNHSKIYKALFKALNHEQIEDISLYKILMLKPL